MERLSDFDATYDVIDFIAEGTFGQVHRVRHRQSLEIFAVKSFDDPWVNGELNHPFYRELVIYSRLECHPSLKLPRCYGYTVNPCRLVLEYFGGDISLQVFEYEQLKDIYRQLLLSLDALHQMGIVHRDIKPGNILYLNTTKRAVIGDMGSAKIMPVLPEKNQATDDVTTYIFCCPEGLARVERDDDCWEYTPAMDIWSLGVTFLYLAGGKWITDAIYKNGCFIDNIEKVYTTTGLEHYLRNTLKIRYTNEQTADIISLISSMLEFKPQDRPSVKELLSRFNVETISPTMVSFMTDQKLDGLSDLQDRYVPYVSESRNDIYHLAQKYIYPKPADERVLDRKYCVLTSYLVEVFSNFGLVPRTFYLGLALFDSYLKTKEVLDMDLQKCGCACQYIASCINEIRPSELDDYVKICAYTYTNREFKKCVDDIMSTLELDALKYPMLCDVIYEFKSEVELSSDENKILDYLTYLSVVSLRRFITGLDVLTLGRRLMTFVIQKQWLADDLTGLELALKHGLTEPGARCKYIYKKLKLPML